MSFYKYSQATVAADDLFQKVWSYQVRKFVKEKDLAKRKQKLTIQESSSIMDEEPLQKPELSKDLYDDLLRLSSGFEGGAWISGVDHQENCNSSKMEVEPGLPKELSIKKSSDWD